MIRADVDDNLWLVDDMANTVTKCDRSGQRLLVLRPKGVVLKEAAEMAETGKIVILSRFVSLSVSLIPKVSLFQPVKSPSRRAYPATPLCSSVLLT